jgi:hypothetical protein
MCLKVTDIQKKIADKDIECYKILSVCEYVIVSPFQEFHYKLGKLYETKLGEIKEGDIYEGFHSCSTIDGAVIYQTINSERIFKCIIPQGATYYEGKSMFFGCFIEGYVSDKIIIKEQIGDKEL